MQNLKLQPGNSLYYSRIDLNFEMASSGPSPAKNGLMAGIGSRKVQRGHFHFSNPKELLFLFFAFLFFAQEIIPNFDRALYLFLQFRNLCQRRSLNP